MPVCRASSRLDPCPSSSFLAAYMVSESSRSPAIAATLGPAFFSRLAKRARASCQLPCRSLPFSRTQGRSRRLRTSASTWWRVLSWIHSSFTSSLMRGRMRITWRWRVSRRMFEPTPSITSMPGTRRTSQERISKMIGLCNSAPTGQTSPRFPASSLVTVRSR